MKALAGLVPGVHAMCRTVHWSSLPKQASNLVLLMNFEGKEVDCHSILVLMPLCRIKFLLVQNVQVDMCLGACVNTIQSKCALSE